jgi:transcriptional regulator with XRE-family HTH domain
MNGEKVQTPLGQRLRQLRLDRKLTLAEVAAQSGSSRSYIWELESKAPPRPSAEKLAAIAEVFGVTVDYLIDGESGSSIEDAVDLAFFRKYQKLDPVTKDKIRRLADLLAEQG